MKAAVLALLVCLLAATSAVVAAERPEVVALNQRLATLQANPDLADVAAYEKLRAQQAVGAVANARSRDRQAAQYLAERRVEIAEVTARTQAARREIQRLERTRSELLLEASRREVARSRQEAERLRIQAQIQAEEAERLRRSAEAESLARLDAEDTLSSVTGQQTRRLDAAREQGAALARQEAELVSGSSLPPSRFNNRGEVFTLGSTAFESGSANLSAAGRASARALAAYLEVTPGSKAVVDGYGDAQTPAQRRADALRDALVESGVGASRLRTAAKGEGSGGRAVELVVTP